MVIIYHVVVGHRQAVRHQTLTLTFPGFESLCPSHKKRTPIGVLFLCPRHSPVRSRSAREAARNGVRIRRSELDKLACQAKSVRIFAEGEYPVAFLLGRQSASFFCARGTAPFDHAPPAKRRGMGFAFAARSSTSSLVRRRACESSREARIPLCPSHEKSTCERILLIRKFNLSL